MHGIGRYIEGTEVRHHGSEPGFLYLSGELVVAKEALAWVNGELDRLGVDIGSESGHDSAGSYVVLHGLNKVGTPVDETEDCSIPTLVGRFAPAATYNHVLYHQFPRHVCPEETEVHVQWFPEHWATPGEPPEFVYRGKLAEDVEVAVYDTGWFFDPAITDCSDPLNDRARDWFRGRLEVPTADVVPPPQVSAISMSEGHGPFCASVVLTVAPDVMVRGFQLRESADGADDPALVTDEHLAVALVEKTGHNRVVSLSYGAFTHDDGDLPLTGGALGRLSDDVIVVAAAGNEGIDKPVYPAAHPRVVGVGALNEEQSERAVWSGWGPWVYTYAPGTGISGIFLTGDYRLTYAGHESDVYVPATYLGGAVWSGTSFAAPFVAGRIAASLREGASREEAIMGVQGTVRS